MGNIYASVAYPGTFYGGGGLIRWLVKKYYFIGKKYDYNILSNNMEIKPN